MSASEGSRLAALVSGVAAGAAAKARTPRTQITRVSQSYAGPEPTYGNAATDAEISFADAGPLPKNAASTYEEDTVTDLHILDKDDVKRPVIAADNLPAKMPKPAPTTVVLSRGIDYLGIAVASPRPEDGTVSRRLSGDADLTRDDRDDLSKL